MKILEVVNENQSNKWLDFHTVLYARFPQFVPHVRQDVASVFDPNKNKLFRDGQAKRWLLVNEHGATLGRIAAFHSVKYSNAQNQKTGGIGFFECENDPNAAAMLLETAEQWLQSIGMQAVDGPINFGEKEAYWGLMVDNFKDLNSFRMNFNPPYYQPFFENAGYQTYYEQWCYHRDIATPAQEVFVRKASRIENEGEFTFSTGRGKNLEQLASDFITVYNAAWAGLPGFSEMKIEQARNIMKAMNPVLDRDITIFAYHQGKPIGFYINLPEVNEFMRYVNGNLNAWGIVKFLWAKHLGKRHTMVGLVFGINREYHGKGVEGALIKWASDHLLQLNRYSETILTWIGDFNPKMIHVAENLGAKRYRTLITYRKMLDKSLAFERHPMVGKA